jgi:hypothetical protein
MKVLSRSVISGNCLAMGAWFHGDKVRVEGVSDAGKAWR